MAREKFQTLTEQMFYILLCLRQECCGTDTDVLAQGILQACACQRIRLTCGKPVQKLGCIRYHDDTPVEPGYFNLLFN